MSRLPCSLCTTTVKMKSTESALSSTSRIKQRSKRSVLKTDILISIKPAYMDQIVNRTKNHEFRSYLIPNTVQRMWLYVSSPQQTLRYVAVIGHGKSTGEIEKGEGLRNADFNQTEAGAYAYKIQGLYQLHQPLPLAEMQQKYGVTFPQRYVYVPETLAKDIVFEDQLRLF